MTNKNFLKMAERMKNPSLPDERSQPIKTTTQKPIAVQSADFSKIPTESFIFSYDHPQHGQFFQELITKHNKIYSGTEAEIPEGKKGEIQGNLIKRIGLISTIANDSNLRSANLYPITPTQSEYLLQAGKLTNPESNWEDLALLLYDTNGENQKEAQAIYESLKKHKNDLGLSQTDLENKLIIVNAGAEVDSSMPHGIKPIILPGLTQVYQHEVLEKVGEDSEFKGYGLNGGLPLLNQLGDEGRTLYMPDETENIGLRVLFRFRDLGLGAWDWDLAVSYSGGRVNFARSASL